MLSQLKSLTKINPPVCVSKYLLATTVVLNIKRAWYSQCTDTVSKLFRQLNSTDLLKVSTYVGSHCLGWVTKVWKQGQNSPETPELASCPSKRAWGPAAKSQRKHWMDQGQFNGGGRHHTPSCRKGKAMVWKAKGEQAACAPCAFALLGVVPLWARANKRHADSCVCMPEKLPPLRSGWLLGRALQVVTCVL